MAEGRWWWRAAIGLLAFAAVAPPGVPAAQAAPAGPAASHRPATKIHRDTDSDTDPLRITIDDLTPGVLPRQGPIQISGTVTNEDSVTWRAIHLYPFIDTDSCVANGTCSPPMHSAEELAEAAKTDPASPVGERLTDLSLRRTISSIAPGRSVSFLMTVPQKALRAAIASPQPGVYWFGVQALGESSTTTRDVVSDGRARTFLPYVPANYGKGVKAASTRLDTAIVASLRAPIEHAADGRIAAPAGWLSELGTDGGLGGPLAIGSQSGGNPVTWLVDPAVPDAVDQLAEGNPARLLPAAGSNSDDTASASATSTDTGTSGSGSAGPLASAADTWLQTVHQALSSGEVLSLPYGDTELTGGGFTHSLYSTARAQPSLLRDWKLLGRRVIAGLDGYVDPQGLAKIDDSSLVLLGDQMLDGTASSAGSPNAAGARIGKHPVAVSASGAGSGGPDPSDRYSAVAVRQRILSEAAVRLLAGDLTPMIVQLPQQMTASGAGIFWSGLDQSWLHLTTVGTIAKSTGRAISASKLRFPATRRQDEVTDATQDQASELIASGNLLHSILTTPHGGSTKSTASPDATTTGDDDTADPNAGLAASVAGEALSSTSYSLRGDTGAEARLYRSRLWLIDRLDSVSISAPSGVTLSSADGSFSVTVVNDLDVPVTVDIAAQADGAQIKKVDPVQLAANSRASVRLDAHTTRPGVHNVHLTLTNGAGYPIGSAVTVPIRSGTVGVVIWIILGTGAGILFFAIGVRLVRRIRGRGERSKAVA